MPSCAVARCTSTSPTGARRSCVGRGHSGQSGAALGFCTGWLEIAVQPQVAQDAGEPQGQALLKDLVILPDFSLDLTGNFSGKHLIQF